jgi:response regulator of citrate/malate metabolism
MVISTLVVDDDYRVADLHAAFVSKTEHFTVVGKAHTAAEVYDATVTLRPDLVLLDLYLPDEHGLDVMRRLQSLDPPHPDVFVITASRDGESIRSAMRLGAVHYIVKPFGFNRLHERLLAYRDVREELSHLAHASQDDVDKLFGLLRPGPERALPKGHSGPTTVRVLGAIRSSPQGITAAAVADKVGISRPTAQRYLAQLVHTGVIELDLMYGTQGRPSHVYRPRR